MIKAILAVENSYGMGFEGTLPWPKNKEDLKHFKNSTTGCTVIMGSGTWDDPCFPAPLKNRDNFVISSKSFENFKGANVISKNIKEFIQYLDSRASNDIWIIGGSSIFELLHDIIEEYHMTIISKNYSCDVFFDLPLDNFKKIKSTRSEEGNYYTVYSRFNKEGE